MWCIAELNEEYIARMEDVLTIYEKPLSEREPVVCVDEKPVVLHADVRPPRSMRPGRIARRDSEYERRGTANVFFAVQPKAGRHFTKPTPNRSSSQFADYLVEIVASYPGGRHHPSGDGQSEFTQSEGAGGPVRRKDRRTVVGAFHGALHPETRQLAEPGGDRDQPVLPSMPGPAENPVPRSATVRSKGMELERNRDQVTINWQFTRRKARMKFGYNRNKITRSET
jgi:hypothetical protein